MSEDVIIIGGGLAGLSAGVAVSQAGRRVRLLEQKPYLGGRARSFRDAATGSIIDNGQHLLMGCYHSTLKLLESIGTQDSVSFPRELRVRFLDAGRGSSELRCPALPSPWHLLSGVLLSGSFTAREKLEVLRMGWRLRSADHARGRRSSKGLTVEEWLIRMGQSESLRRRFWDLLCIAMMNEDPGIASASIFESVLRRALFTSCADSKIGIPRKGLSECYTEAAAAVVEDRGGQVELRRDVRAILIDGKKCAGVRLADGSELQANTVISAVPWHVLPGLLPAEIIDSEPLFCAVRQLRPAPIISIYLWFDRPVADVDFAGLRGTTIQWLFNKGQILGTGENYVSIVLSGAHRYVCWDKEELRDLALRELELLIPAMSGARLTHWQVIKERFATFSPALGVESLRPPARTPIKGLYLAGDWTATGLPATIEGAVQSGFAASEEILQTA